MRAAKAATSVNITGIQGSIGRDADRVDHDKVELVRFGGGAGRMGEAGTIGEEQRIEGVRPVEGDRRAINYDVLPVEAGVGLAEDRVGGEDGGVCGRGE